METKSFKFVTNFLNYEEIGSKSNKEYYVKGYISTDEIDRTHEIVTREAMSDMVTQIKNGNIKLDVEHGTFTGDADIPVGKIVDAGMNDTGLWVKCILNKAHSKFGEIWKSVKDGFLDAFSIAYKITDRATDFINGVQVTLVKGLELFNVAITGNPICRSAKMTESFYKSLKYLDEQLKSGEDNMVEPEIKQKVEPVVEPKVEPVVEPKVEPVVEPKVEPVVEPKVEPEVTPKVEPEVAPLDTIKSMQTEIAELKAEVKTLNKELIKPQLKAINNTDIAEVKDETPIVKSPLQAIK